MRDSGDSGLEGEDQKHFSKLLKMRFIKKLHKKITKKKEQKKRKRKTQKKSAHVQGVPGIHEGFMRDS